MYKIIHTDAKIVEHMNKQNHQKKTAKNVVVFEQRISDANSRQMERNFENPRHGLSAEWPQLGLLRANCKIAKGLGDLVVFPKTNLSDFVNGRIDNTYKSKFGALEHLNEEVAEHLASQLQIQIFRHKISNYQSSSDF